ncbi:MAG TPA: hypothetical protein VFD53_00320, partial [Ilumatobacter sp.]|nr:hypothetical protein [Ilumatobacter sp.]
RERTPAHLIQPGAPNGASASGLQTLELQVTETGASDVPTDAGAVVLNVTVTNTDGPGFVTVWPCGRPRPLASNLNFITGATIPNLVVVGVGDNGKVCLYTSAGTDLIADINAYL